MSDSPTIQVENTENEEDVCVEDKVDVVSDDVDQQVRSIRWIFGQSNQNKVDFLADPIMFEQVLFRCQQHLPAQTWMDYRSRQISIKVDPEKVSSCPGL